MAEFEALAKIYADLIRRGERTLESIKNAALRAKVQSILEEDEQQ